MNVIFVALTTYQLMIANAYARYIKKRFDIEPVVIVDGTDIKHLQPDEYKLIQIPIKHYHNKIWRVWKRLFYAGNLFRLCKINRRIDFKQNTVLFLFNDTEPISYKLMTYVKKKNSLNKVVIIDEGIGLYSDTVKHKKKFIQKFRSVFTKCLGSPMQKRSIGDSALIDVAIVGNADIYKALSKSKSQDVLLQSKTKIIIEANSFAEQYIGEKVESFNCDVLYLGQTYNDTGSMTDDEFSNLSWLLSNISDGNRVMIKPHPRDAKGKYDSISESYSNVYVLNGVTAELPIECIISMFDNPVVISFNSSALINIANIFPDTCCIATFDMPIANVFNREKKTVFLKENKEIFKSIYQNLFIPATESEFRVCLTRTNENARVASESAALNEFPEIDYILSNQCKL